MLDTNKENRHVHIISLDYLDYGQIEIARGTLSEVNSHHSICYILEVTKHHVY